jgi:hypothetical protein
VSSRASLGLAVGLALAVAVPAGTATATVGDFTNPAAFRGKRIVDGVSIGGVKVGMRKAQAIAVWGKPDGVCRRENPYDPDDRRRACSYGTWVEGKSEKESGRPYAGFTHSPSGVVTSVHLVLVKVAGKSFERRYNLAAREVLPLKTGRKIGLRSTLADARRAYGLPLPAKPVDDEPSLWKTVVVRQPQGCTVFGWYDSAPAYTYIDSIQVTAPEWCPKDAAEEDS